MIIDSQIKRLLYGCAGMNAVRMMTGSFHVFYLFSLGVSVPQIALLQMVFSVSVFLFELPTGILGDKLSVKKNVLISCIFYAAFFPLCTYAPDMFLLILAEVCYALGACFFSGADSTWLKGLVDHKGEGGADAYHHYMSYVREINALMNSVSGAIGVLIVLSCDSFSSVYYICSFLFVLIMIFLNSINDVSNKLEVKEIKERFNAYAHIRGAIIKIFSTRVGAYYIIISGLVIGAMQPVYHLWQPFILERTGLLNNVEEKKEIVILGVCFFSYSFSKYLFNRYLRTVFFKKYKPMYIILITTILSSITMFLLLITGGKWLPIVVFTLFHCVFSVPMTQFSSEYFKHLDMKNSNTVLSIISLLSRAFGIVSLGVIGFLSERYGIRSAFAFAFFCITMIIPVAAMWLIHNRKHEKIDTLIVEEIK